MCVCVCVCIYIYIYCVCVCVCVCVLHAHPAWLRCTPHRGNTNLHCKVALSFCRLQLSQRTCGSHCWLVHSGTRRSTGRRRGAALFRRARRVSRRSSCSLTTSRPRPQSLLCWLRSRPAPPGRPAKRDTMRCARAVLTRSCGRCTGRVLASQRVRPACPCDSSLSPRSSAPPARFRVCPASPTALSCARLT